MKNLVCSTALAMSSLAGIAQTTNYEVRYASNPVDFKTYDTERIRKDFLIEDLFIPGQTNMVYTMHDRFIVGGIVPLHDALPLETIDPLKANYFLERRELGVINIGGEGVVRVNGKEYDLGYKEALYVGKDNEEVVFQSKDPKKPAIFYFNSANAHKAYPTKLIRKEDARVLNLGSSEQSNERQIIQYIVNQTVQTCQLQLGMTELKSGSVWNTMPTHFHDRRMEVYLYFELPEEQAVCHYIGRPDETRHIWMKNMQATISPEWSIHSAAGTSSYTFIWGMAGENLDYGDVDKVSISELR